MRHRTKVGLWCAALLIVVLVGWTAWPRKNFEVPCQYVQDYFNEVDALYKARSPSSKGEYQRIERDFRTKITQFCRKHPRMELDVRLIGGHAEELSQERRDLILFPEAKAAMSILAPRSAKDTEERAELLTTAWHLLKKKCPKCRLPWLK